jgi:hypothetical protein
MMSPSIWILLILAATSLALSEREEFRQAEWQATDMDFRKAHLAMSATTHERHFEWYKRAKQLGQLVFQEFERRNTSFAFDPQPSLIRTRVWYLHVPKCGGTGIPVAIWGVGQRSLRVWDADSPLDLVRALEQVVSRGVTAIYGHIPYGMHLVLADSLPYTYATMLRDPVERTVSHYYYHLARKDDPGHALAASLSLEQWLWLSPSGNNRMTQFISGYISQQPVTRAMLEIAKHNLRKCSFVGLLERYNDSMQMLAYQTGRILGGTYGKHVNINRSKPSTDSLSAETIEAVRQANQLDQELYDLAVEIFETRWRNFLDK